MADPICACFTNEYRYNFGYNNGILIFLIIEFSITQSSVQSLRSNILYDHLNKVGYVLCASYTVV